MILSFPQLIEHAVKMQATHIHLNVDMPPMIRINGKLKEVKIGSLTAAQIVELFSKILDQSQIDSISRGDEITLVHHDSASGAAVVINALFTQEGIASSIKLLTNKAATIGIEEIDISHRLKNLSELTQGLILITGATGSGKSATLAAIINYINSEHNKNIIVLDKFNESIYKSHKSIINHAKIGNDDDTKYINTLKKLANKDCDVVAIDNCKMTLELVECILDVASSGQLVFVTMLATSSVKAISDLVYLLPQASKENLSNKIAQCLEGVVHQKLFVGSSSKRVAALEIIISDSTIKKYISSSRLPDLDACLKNDKIYPNIIKMKDALKDLLSRGIIAASIEGLEYDFDLTYEKPMIISDDDF